MQKIPVYLSGMKEVQQFVDLINRFEYNCDLCCGSYFVDAKSLLGVVTLQGSSNVELIIHADKPDKLMKNIEQYCC
ncbi:HPr family phosphocarrier protein [Anaerobium acetethylicum]|uniref:PTS HPr component phosphorylation site n=1 Tax=Anaerobium acetethylicum TaxID=1619234 RepID=A0A1D3TW62_9FIRM|nr:HPr family phosphocarrier protein [Anaerobium acetethylicum]SCP98438.1 PTS HPr component phosphorylation site [Anaerobium acetethylicum]